MIHYYPINMNSWLMGLQSAVATHHLINGHELNPVPVPKLLKNLTGRSEMTMLENFLILKNKERVMKFEIPPSDVLIKKFVLKPTVGIKATPTMHPTGQETTAFKIRLKMGTPALETCPVIKQVSDV